MIKGIGVDIVELEQFKKVENNEEFLRQVFTESERANIAGRSKRDISSAMLFATKESILKALGCGLHYGSFWHDIEVNAELMPQVRGFVSKFADEPSGSNIKIASSRSRRYSVAFVIIED